MAEFNKSLVALVMAGVGVASIWLGRKISIDEGTVSALIGVATSLLVYLIPNTKPKGS